MKKYIFSWVLLGLIITSCGNDNSAANWGAQEQAVNVVEVPTGDFLTYNFYPTSIEGVNNSEARPKISGYITEVLVDEGQKVRKGQLLFRLETATLTKEAEAAKANVKAAEVQVSQLEPLVEKGIVSQSQLETAKARLKQAESGYSSIAANISYANVTSPVDGYVGKIRIRQGNLVSPADPQPLTVVSSIDKVYAYFSMSERDYLNFLLTAEGDTREEKIKNMPKVGLVMANGEEYMHEGVIETINSQVDRATGSISFRAVFDNKEQLLTNGSSGKIKIPKEYKDVVIVPRKSTFEQQGMTYVVKVVQTDSATIAKRTSVVVEDKTRNLLLIQEGVEKGDFIVAEGPGSVRSGSAVKATKVDFDSIAKPVPVLF